MEMRTLPKTIAFAILLAFSSCSCKSTLTDDLAEKWIQSTIEFVKNQCVDYENKKAVYESIINPPMDGQDHVSLEDALRAKLTERKTLFSNLADSLKLKYCDIEEIWEIFHNGKYKCMIKTTNRRIITYDRNLILPEEEPDIKLHTLKGNDNLFDWEFPGYDDKCFSIDTESTANGLSVFTKKKGLALTIEFLKCF
jgi:hypothetical protein